MSGAGLPFPAGIRGSSPSTRCCCSNTEKTSSRCAVLRPKLFLLEEVARAMCTFGLESRRFSRWRTPGSGCVEGKYFCCRAEVCWRKSSRVMGSWAHSWKMRPACDGVLASLLLCSLEMVRWTYLWSGASLQLSLDVPWQIGLSVLS